MAHARPWYKRNGADLVMATLGFPSIEHRWAYSAIIDMLNDRDRPLADDPGFICGFTGLSKRKWKDVRAYLIAEGYLVELGDGTLTNPRFERERAERLADAERSAAAGRRGGLKSAAQRAAKQGQMEFISEKTEGFSGDNREINGRLSGDNPPLNEQEQRNSAISDQAPPQPSCARECASEARGERREEENITNGESEKHARTPIDRSGLLTLTQMCARTGGVTLHPERPQSFAREMDIVKAWVADGVDIEKTAVPVIAGALARMKDDDTVGSLKFFDGRVRKAHARTLGAGGEPAGPSAFDDAAARAAYLAKLNSGTPH